MASPTPALTDRLSQYWYISPDGDTPPVVFTPRLRRAIQPGWAEENLRTALDYVRPELVDRFPDSTLDFSAGSGTSLDLEMIRVEGGPSYEDTTPRKALAQLRAEVKPGSASGSSTPLSLPSTSSAASFATRTPNLSQLPSIPSEDTHFSHSSTLSSATSPSFVRSQLSLPSLTSDSKAGVRFPDHLSFVKWSPAPGLTWCKVTQVTEIKCPDPPLVTTPTFNLPSPPVTGQHTTLPFGTLYAPDKCMLGLAQQILYLITANEMCGTKWGMFVYGSQFCRMIHLQRSNNSETPHIAIEIAPSFNSGSDQSQSAASTPTQSTFARAIPAVSFLYNPQIREFFPNDLLKGSGIDSEAYNAFRDFYKAALNLCLSFTIEECSQRIGADQSPTIGQSGVGLRSRTILEVDNIRLVTQTARWSQLRSTISSSSVSRRSSSSSPIKSTSPKKGENKEKSNKRQKGKSTDIGPQLPYRKRDDDDDDTGAGGGPKGGQRRTLRGFPGSGATTLPKSSKASQPDQGRGAQGGTSLSMSELLFAKISAWSLAIQDPSVGSKDHSCYGCDGACQSDEGIHLSDYSDTPSQDSGIGSGGTCGSGIPLSVLVDIIHRMGVKIVGVTKGEMDQLMRLSATSGIAYPLESTLAGSGDYLRAGVDD